MRIFGRALLCSGDRRRLRLELNHGRSETGIFIEVYLFALVFNSAKYLIEALFNGVQYVFSHYFPA